LQLVLTGLQVANRGDEHNNNYERNNDDEHNIDRDSDAGHICPDTSCDDEVFLPLDTRLDQMFSRFRAMKNEWNQTGRRPQGYQILKMEIHMAIAAQADAPRLRSIAVENEWPLEIDFMDVPRRVQAMKDEISGFIENDIVLQCSMMWKLFVNALKANSFTFARFKKLLAPDKFDLLRSTLHAG
jgi:hypothetical protein